MILTIVVLSLLVLLHELGHFLIAKLFGIDVEELALDSRHELSRFLRNETEYTLNWLPIGGFVRMLERNKIRQSSKKSTQ